MNDNSYKIIEVDINEILPNRFQPRIQFDEEEILELSDSIKEHGVIQPIIVRKIGDKYEIIAGERRYKASVLAGKDTVPVIIKNLNDKDSAEIALIENIQRKNLTPIEEALSYKKILDMGYLTQESLATKIGKSQSSVANKVRLLNLSDEVQEALLDNKISERHARSLLRLKSSSEQNQMLEKIIKERLTVRKTDEEIDKVLKINIDLIEKEEKKGDEEMNNGINQIPNIEIQPNNTFDIFGGTTPTNISPSVPEVASAPAVAPVTPEVPQIGGIQFDANGNVIAAPSVPEIASAPAVAPVAPEVPQMGGIQFDANGNVIAAPVTPDIPQTHPIEISDAPKAIPELQIIEQPVVESKNVNNVIPQTSPTKEEAVNAPIIITDYDKQYDPIIPGQAQVIPEKVDFKEIVNIIRECSSKIEKYGYKIDVEEYDLSTLYQVVFKIEK